MTNKYIVFALLFAVSQVVLGQSNTVPQAILDEWNDPVIQQLYTASAPWGQYQQQNEDVSKRTQTSKHFSSGGNNFQGFLGSGPLHYQQNSVWLTIATNVVSNTSGNHPSYPLYNKWNAFKTYYGNSGVGELIDLPNNQSVEIGKNAQWHWMDANGNNLGSVAATTGIVPASSSFTSTYTNIFNGIDAKVDQLSKGIESSYLINNLASFQNAPAQAEYVAFAETINMPANWSVAGLGNKGSGMFDKIDITNGNTSMLRYEIPKMWENLTATRNQQGSTERKLQGVYRFTQTGNQVTVYTLVPVAWLLSADRTFPITIDPTVTIYPYASALATQEIEDAVSDPRIGFYDGTFGNTYYSSAMDFDTSPIPDVNASGVTSICNVALYLYQIGYEGPTNCGSCSNPNGSFTFVSMLGGYPVAAQGYGTLYNEIYNGLPYTNNVPSEGWGGQGGYSYGTNNVWHNWTLNLQARQDMKNLLGTNHFPVGIRNDYQSHSDPTLCGFFTICDDDDYVTWQGNTQPGTQPYLIVDYQASLAIAPPSASAACGNGTDANPNNDWMLFGYHGTDLTLTNSNIYYDGYAAIGGLDVVSTNLWAAAASPSSTSGFQGCAVPNDNHIAVLKRCGFPCGQYNLSIANLNGQGQFYLNGAFISAFSANTNLLTNAVLDANSSIEIRYSSTTGASQITLDFTRIDNWKATAGLDIQACPGDNLTLSAGVNGSGTPGTMPCLSGPAGSCGPTAYSWASNCAGFNNSATTSNTSFNYQGGACEVYLIITSEIGCTSRDTVNIAELPTPTVTATAQFTQVCSGSNADILLSNYPPGTQFCITVLNASTTAAQCPTLITPVAGALAIPVTLPSGVNTPQQVQIIVKPSLPIVSCAGIPDTVTLTVLPQPQIIVGGQSIVCSGDPINICLFNTLGGNTAYTWARTNNNVTGLPLTGAVLPPSTCITGALINNTAIAQTTNFSFTVVGGTCSAAPTTYTVVVNPSPAASISASAPCTGATLTALPAGMNYSWSTGQTSQSITPSIAGTYDVWVTNNTNCTKQASAVINTAPVVSITTNPANTTSTCGGQIQMNAQAFPSATYTYAWNPATCTGPSCTVSQAGNYTYTVSATDVATGCTATSAPLNITVFDKPSIALGASTGSPSPLCEDANANLNVVFGPNGTSVAPYNYNWYSITNGSVWLPVPNANADNIPAIVSNGGLVTEYYVAVITDANGCGDTTNIFAVNQNPNITLTALDNTSTACQGDTLDFTYTSSIGGIFNCGSLGGGVANCNNGYLYTTQSGTYWVMCQAPNGCIDTVYTPALTFNPTPTAVISLAVGEDSLLCKNESVVLTAAPSGQTSYQWWLNGVQIPGATTETYTASAGGDYAVQVGNSFGCMGMDMQTITVLDTLLINIISSQPDLAFCQGQDNAILTVNQGGANYVWTMGSVTYVGNPFQVNGSNYQANGIVNVAVTNAAGCVSHDMIQIKMDTVPQPLIAEALGSGLMTLCIGDTLTLHGIGGPSYEWRKDGQILIGGSGANYTVFASNDLTQWVGNYNLYVTNAGGCKGESKTFVIQANPEPFGVTYVVGNTHICKGQSATLVTSDLTGNPVWTFNGVEIPNSSGASEITVTEPGQYNVTVTNACGSYTVPTPITITRNDFIFANFIFAPTLIHTNELVYFSNQSVGGQYANWSFGDGVNTTSYNTQHSFVTPGEYQVQMTLSDALGCQDDTIKTLTVIPWGEIFIPNTFTPNGDGAHDEFVIYYADLQGTETIVYDRWGAPVFTTLAKDKYWNGTTTSGKEAEAGIYYYVITASKADGTKVVYKGYVSLMR